MTLNAQDLCAWHDRATGDDVAQRDKFAELGFRPLSLPRAGSPAFLPMVRLPAEAECRAAW
jgi:hypothetical protein